MTEKIKDLANSALLDLIVKAAILMLLPWMIWATNQIYGIKGFMSEGNRFTSGDAAALEMRAQAARHAQEMRTILTIRNFADEFTRDFVRKDELPNIVK